MTSLIRNSSRLIASVMILLVIALGSGCKSKKKAMEAAKVKAEQERLEKEAALEKQKRDEQARREAEEQAKRDAEAAAARNVEPRQKLNGYFNSISSAGSVAAANGSINEALTLFATPQTPVLIVISEYNGQKDYDKPTTIIDYLNYLKDQKKNMNKISDVKYDASGKITELELTKTK